MFWELDAKHVAIITEEETDTEKCFWKIDVPGILQCHHIHVRTRQSPRKLSVKESWRFLD